MNKHYICQGCIDVGLRRRRAVMAVTDPTDDHEVTKLDMCSVHAAGLVTRGGEMVDHVQA